MHLYTEANFNESLTEEKGGFRDATHLQIKKKKFCERSQQRILFNLSTQLLLVHRINKIKVLLKDPNDVAPVYKTCREEVSK